MVELTIFPLHMTAYLVVVWAYEGLGGTLRAEPTAGWWAQRWQWLLAPLGRAGRSGRPVRPVELAARRPRQRAVCWARHLPLTGRLNLQIVQVLQRRRRRPPRTGVPGGA